jgi:hypothetical protein
MGWSTADLDGRGEPKSGALSCLWDNVSQGKDQQTGPIYHVRKSGIVEFLPFREKNKCRMLTISCVKKEIR